jgi:hypothetical protein
MLYHRKEKGGKREKTYKAAHFTDIKAACRLCFTYIILVIADIRF